VPVKNSIRLRKSFAMDGSALYTLQLHAGLLLFTVGGMGLGLVDGSVLGSDEGIVEGSRLGPKDGLFEGDPDGCSEGTELGPLEGAADGVRDGEELLLVGRSEGCVLIDG